MSINKSVLGLYPLLFAVLIVANILIPKVDARDINNQNGIFADTRITSHVSKQYNPPFVYKNNNVISVVATTTEEVLNSLVPEPLVINEENQIIFFIGELSIVEPTSLTYKEAGILVPVTYFDSKSNQAKSAYFVPVLYLDDFYAITSARETYGFNKHYAPITLVEEAGSVSGKVFVNDKVVFEINVKALGDKYSETYQIEHGGYVLEKIIPSGSYDGTLDVHKLNLAEVNNFYVSESRAGKGELIFNDSDYENLSDISIDSIIGGYHQVSGSTLNKSRTIHNYLK